MIVIYFVLGFALVFLLGGGARALGFLLAEGAFNLYDAVARYLTTGADTWNFMPRKLANTMANVDALLKEIYGFKP